MPKFESPKMKQVSMEITVLGTTVLIMGTTFLFSYTPAEEVVKPEFKGVYHYFGGLQSSHKEGSEEHTKLEISLIEIARAALTI